MTLANLLKIGRLKTHAPTGAEIQRLLAAAARNLADARVAAVSDETRFDAAYKAIMQMALAECVKQAEYIYLVVESWLYQQHLSLLNEN